MRFIVIKAGIVGIFIAITSNSTEGVADPTARRYNEIHSHKGGNSRNLLANEIYVNRSHINTSR